MTTPIEVILAEDNAFLREGLRVLLSHSSEIEVLVACSSIDEVLSTVDEHRPHVVLTDLRMPPGNNDEGVVIATQLAQTHPDVGVLVLSQYLEADLASELLRDGSAGRGYIMKDRADDAIYVVQAIQTVAAGGTFVDDRVVDALIRQRNDTASDPVRLLSPREHQVLQEIASGKTNAAIADALVISEHAVQKHINSIFSKLGLVQDDVTHRRVAAVLLHLSSDTTRRGGR